MRELGPPRGQFPNAAGFTPERANARVRPVAFDYKHKKWLDQLPRRPAAIIEAFVRQFERNSIDELENPQIFKVQSVREAGGQEASQEAGDAPGELAREAKERIFTA